MIPENLRIEGLSLKQLDALAAAIAQRREYLVYEDRKRVRALLIEEASKEGFTVQELFALGGGSATRVPAAAKLPRLAAGVYQDPNDPARTWTGRGPRPAWFKAALEAGTPAVALRVDAAAR